MRECARDRSRVVQKLLRRGEELRLQACAADQQFKRFPHRDVVAHDEHDRRGVRRGQRRRLVGITL
jgi:hypothetical protein